MVEAQKNDLQPDSDRVCVTSTRYLYSDVTLTSTRRVGGTTRIPGCFMEEGESGGKD